MSKRPDLALDVGMPFLLVFVFASSAGQPVPRLHDVSTPMKTTRQIDKNVGSNFLNIPICRAFGRDS